MASESTDTSGIAERYATALYDMADEAKQLDGVADDLRGLKSLLEDYRMFDNLDPVLLIDAIEDHAAFYDISAWGERAAEVRELLEERGPA